MDSIQLSSSTPPTPYGFIPRTLSADQCAKVAGLPKCDGHPLNICVLSEVPINQSDIPIEVRIVGGLLIENGCLVDD